MSKLLPTLFLLLILVVVGGIGYLSVTEVPVEQETIEETVTYEEFLLNKKK